MTSIFTAGEADLSGITGRKDLYVSDAVHKAMLEVQREKEKFMKSSEIIFSSIRKLNFKKTSWIDSTIFQCTIPLLLESFYMVLHDP